MIKEIRIPASLRESKGWRASTNIYSYRCSTSVDKLWSVCMNSLRPAIYYHLLQKFHNIREWRAFPGLTAVSPSTSLEERERERDAISHDCLVLARVWKTWIPLHFLEKTSAWKCWHLLIRNNMKSLI